MTSNIRSSLVTKGFVGILAALLLLGFALAPALLASPVPSLPVRAAPQDLSPASYLPLVLAPENTPTPTKTPTVTPAPTIPGTPSGSNVVCHPSGAAQICAWIDRPLPSQNMAVTVSGRLLINNVGQSNQTMNTTWHYKTVTSYCSGLTDFTGVASCARTIGRATLGYQVNINVNIAGYGTTTWITPQSRFPSATLSIVNHPA